MEDLVDSKSHLSLPSDVVVENSQCQKGREDDLVRLQFQDEEAEGVVVQDC